MNHDTTPRDLSKIRVVYAMPTSDAVKIRRDQEYRMTDAGALAMDVYYPPDASSGSRTPSVIFVTGFSDVGVRRMFGCAMKDMAASVSWARLAAASGMVAITYTNREPATDVRAVLDKQLFDLTAVANIRGIVPIRFQLLLQQASVPVGRCAGSEKHLAHVVVDTDNAITLLMKKSHGLGSDQAGRARHQNRITH